MFREEGESRRNYIGRAAALVEQVSIDLRFE